MKHGIGPPRSNLGQNENHYPKNIAHNTVAGSVVNQLDAFDTW